MTTLSDRISRPKTPEEREAHNARCRRRYAESNLTHARLLELLSYDPNTGIFTARVTRRPRVYAGTVVGHLSYNRNHIYLRATIDGHIYMAHRLAWFYVHGVWPTQVIDHIDGDGTNNAIANLRDVSASVNGQNIKAAMCHNKLGVLGVSAAGNRFTANIRINGKPTYLGSFKTIQDAHQAYLEAKRKHHPGFVALENP